MVERDNWCQPFQNSSANKMQQLKQVEVRMDESHLEAKADAPESMCSMVCDKIMKNMVLTLTVLGKYFWHQGSAPACICLLEKGRQMCSHLRTINLNCLFLGKREHQEPWGETLPPPARKTIQMSQCTQIRKVLSEKQMVWWSKCFSGCFKKQDRTRRHLHYFKVVLGATKVKSI